MYLKSLELQGFKSFPDKTLIRFGDDITAIVGPNGSGKSNISDAILWVMGEQSSKTLRGAKMEDVIFGGTQKRSAVGFAEATLTLDNSDRALRYDADEVMVTRRYYRSGDSEYYINRQSARLRDINEMFMDTGMGKEGYSNIGQGRIDEILSLKSADRREIFEEAAGISKYRHRKEETERKLERTEDNLLRIGDKVSELELQLEPLKIQSEKAKKYLELKGELQGVEVTVWLDMLEKLSAAAKKAEEDYKSASFVLQQAHEDLDKLYAQAEQLGDSLRDKDGELETVRLKVNMLEANHQQLDGQMAVLRGNIENNNSNIARIEEELQGQEDRSGGIQNQIRQAKERIGQIETTLTAKKKEIEQLQQNLAAMTANAQGYTRQFLELRGQETSLASDIAGREADLRGLEESMQQNKERLAQLDADLETGEERDPDNTLEVLKQIAAGNPKVKVLALTRNFGQHSALMAGYNHVTGDIVVCLDDDGQNPPEEMFKLIDKLDEGYDLVSARYAKKKHNLIRRLGSKVSFAMSRYLVGMPKDIDLNSYCVFRRFVADEVVKYRNAYPFVHGLMLRITRNIANVDISHQDRQSGSSGYNIGKLIALWMNGFTAFSEKPLRLASVLGFLCAALGFLYSLVIIVQRIMNPAIPAGYSSLMAVVLILCGMIMLLLGLMGEYIGRIYICLNNAPQYAIRESINVEQTETLAEIK